MTETELYAAFGHAVADWHRRGPERSGEPIMCTCGVADVLCAYRGLLRRLGLAAPVGPTREPTR